MRIGNFLLFDSTRVGLTRDSRGEGPWTGRRMTNKIDHDKRKENIRSLIVGGRSNRDIAAALGLDLRTVDHYIRRYGLTGLRRQLGIKSAAGHTSAPPDGAPQRQCLGCGKKILAVKGRWFCDQCRARRAWGSRGVPDHWLETPGHG